MKEKRRACQISVCEGGKGDCGERSDAGVVKQPPGAASKRAVVVRWVLDADPPVSRLKVGQRSERARPQARREPRSIAKRLGEELRKRAPDKS